MGISSQYSAFDTAWGATRQSLYTPAYNYTITLQDQRVITATAVNQQWNVVAQATYVTSQQPSLTYCYGTYTRIA